MILALLLLYLFIGVIIAAFMNYPPEDYATFAIFLTIIGWPILIGAFLVIGVVDGIFDLVERFRD